MCVGLGSSALTSNHLECENRVWTINTNSAVQYKVFKCTICCRMRGKLGFQKMAHLSARRCMVEVPFTYSGVNMYGLILIRQRQAKLKRYASFFTCFSSFFVHFDFTIIIDTYSFTMRQEEMQFDQHDQITEQTLLVQILNYRKHWMRWMMTKSRPSCKEMVLIWLFGIRRYLCEEWTKTI